MHISQPNLLTFLAGLALNRFANYAHEPQPTANELTVASVVSCKSGSGI